MGSSKDGAVTIGDNVYVGPNASLDGCLLESFSYVGMGASVGKGSVVESFAVVAAGASVPENTTVPSGQIFAGSPAQYLRDLTQQEKHLIGEHSLEMQQLAQVYNEMTELTLRERLDQQDDLIKYNFQDPQEKVEEALFEYGMPQTHDDLEYIEHRVYHDYMSTVDYDFEAPIYQHGSFDKSCAPYEQDLSQYPEVFKKYQENYELYDKVKTRFETEDPFAEQADNKTAKKLPRDMAPWESKFDTMLPRYTGTTAQ